MKSKLVVSLFASSMLLLAGCDDNDLDNYTLCYDNDNDQYCDDSSDQVDPNSYVVINGKREAYIVYDSYDSSSSGG
ncbi:hypothetical protein MK805_09995 [Shimazuella sp. AN120528]|uniref:hypothetical protein n=1 Tax=Shimazuella soli TaxID=1892854 RepID=UPI001F113B78|nr:hypothetical protein [Shimazuella soli]MCH5585300.1 hypothetical protein [Shimazuella soli]